MIDNAQISKAAKMAGDWWAARLGDRYKEMANFFSEAVATRVEERLRAGELCVSLVCDYEPWDDLLDAVREAVEPDRVKSGTSLQNVLPQKHSLLVKSDRLVPKEGYGNYTATIWL